MNKNDKELEKRVHEICKRIEEKYPKIRIGYQKNIHGVYCIFHDQYDLDHYDDEFDSFINELDEHLLGDAYTACAYVTYDENTEELLTYTHSSANVEIKYDDIKINSIVIEDKYNARKKCNLQVTDEKQSNSSTSASNIMEAA